MVDSAIEEAGKTARHALDSDERTARLAFLMLIAVLALLLVL